MLQLPFSKDVSRQIWVVELVRDDNQVQTELKTYNGVINIRSCDFDKT